MKFGLYEIVGYLRKDDSILQEKIISDICYFIAVPQEEYYIKVFCHRDPVTLQFPMEYMRIALFVGMY